MASEEHQVDEQAPAAAPSPGRILREERKRQGLSQEDMANKLFLRVHNIVEIEEDRLDDNTSVTFTKGYVRMYAKQLGIDDKAVVAEFEKLHTAPKPPAKLQSFSRRVAKQAHDDRWMMVTYVILFLLIAGVVAWWYQQASDEPLTEEETVGPPASVSVAQQGAVALQEDLSTQGDVPARSRFAGQYAEESSALPQQAATLADEGGIEPDEEPESEQQSTVVTPQEPEPSLAENDRSAAPSEEPTDNSSASVTEVTFTFGTDCWVNIEDATGEAIAYGVKQAGRVMKIEGVPPFEVTLGAPDNVTINYAGKNVDMSSYQNGRTARFTLPMQE